MRVETRLIASPIIQRRYLVLPRHRTIDSLYSDVVKVVSFSVDSKRDTWIKSLGRDRVSWTSLWDGDGTFSDTYIHYGIFAFPTFILIDPNGVIVDKWSGYGDGDIKSKLLSHAIVQVPIDE